MVIDHYGIQFPDDMPPFGNVMNFSLHINCTSPTLYKFWDNCSQREGDVWNRSKQGQAFRGNVNLGGIDIESWVMQYALMGDVSGISRIDDAKCYFYLRPNGFPESYGGTYSFTVRRLRNYKTLRVYRINFEVFWGPHNKKWVKYAALDYKHRRVPDDDEKLMLVATLQELGHGVK